MHVSAMAFNALLAVPINQHEDCVGVFSMLVIAERRLRWMLCRAGSWLDYQHARHRHHIQAFLAVPIHQHEECVGVLSIGSRHDSIDDR